MLHPLQPQFLCARLKSSFLTHSPLGCSKAVLTNCPPQGAGSKAKVIKYNPQYLSTWSRVNVIYSHPQPPPPALRGLGARSKSSVLSNCSFRALREVKVINYHQHLHQSPSSRVKVIFCHPQPPRKRPESKVIVISRIAFQGP